MLIFFFWHTSTDDDLLLHSRKEEEAEYELDTKQRDQKQTYWRRRRTGQFFIWGCRWKSSSSAASSSCFGTIRIGPEIDTLAQVGSCEHHQFALARQISQGPCRRRFEPWQLWHFSAALLSNKLILQSVSNLINYTWHAARLLKKLHSCSQVSHSTA